MMRLLHRISAHIQLKQGLESQLLKGLNSVEFKTQISVCPGTEDGKFPSVDKLAAHILRIDSLMAVAGSNAFGGGFSKQASVQNRGKGNGKGGNLNANGGVQKTKAKPKPAHADALSFKERAQ